jgi:hypothetical protein
MARRATSSRISGFLCLVKRIAIVGLLMICTLGSGLAEIDASKLITGNEDSPEAVTAIHYGPEGKLIWIF